ncbi:L-aminoadipate-semialdehyde dehydrogenase [Mycena sanguinolenta]|uniref:L-aminoadipate-semialdehyde dehydrogenase n=1 Tax=Mycena sanguinolenta TaxID=230812 RepID=A0A8H6X8N4_9AGAR|nr:L-aminoadipate-semialdehyde dehydrogenase [Mycena sanguinolenta]
MVGGLFSSSTGGAQGVSLPPTACCMTLRARLASPNSHSTLIHLRSHPQQAQLDDALERLRFWTSPNIAPHVRVCFTREVWYLWQESASSRKDDGEHVLINAFFESLPHFTGLERLYAQDIQFTPTGITNLCGLPALTYLEVSGGTNLIREQVDPALTLRITNMTMRLHHRREDAWFSLLSPDALRELELFNPVALAKSDVAPFPNVHTLKAGHLSGHAVEIFNKFPNLRSFSDTYGDVLRNLTLAQELSIFPVLEEYTGTHQNLHIFVQRATLTHITLASGLLFADLAAELHGISASPNITFLAVRFITSESDQDAFGEAETEALFSFFPNLTELQLTLIPTEHGELLARRMTSFLQMLPSRFFLPSTLHSISLKWDFSQCDKSDLGMWHNLESPSDISDFATLRAGLVAKCPALAYILLDRYHFLFLWSKTSSVWEATAYTYRDAEIIRRQLRRNI